LACLPCLCNARNSVYGTQIFWLLPTPPVLWSALFIIDSAYLLPLLAGGLAATIMSRNSTRGHTVNTVCLDLCTQSI
jgi:inner membrane protein